MTQATSASALPSSSSTGKPLRQRILHAGSWSIFGFGMAQVLRLVSNLVMTRLLEPSLFGLMALTMSIAVVVTLLADIGVRQAVVQSQRGESPEMLGTAWAMQIVRGFVIWFVCILIAIVVDRLRAHGFFEPHSVYASPQLPYVIVAVTFATVIAGFGSTKAMVAERKLDLKRISIIEVLSQTGTIVVMASLAYFWRTVWSLVIGAVFGSVVTMVLSHVWLHGPRDRWRWDRGCVREIVHFGRWIIASSAMYVLSTNGDRLMLGAWITQKQLAFYYIALTLAQAVEVALGRITASVATPAFSEVVRRDVAGLPKAYWRLRMPMDAAILGVAGLLFGVGHVIIGILYDARYHEAGHILEILSCSLVFSRYGLSTSVYLALGTTKYLSAINFVKLAALFIALPLGFRWWGEVGAYWAIALHLAFTLPLYYLFNRRHGLWDWRKEFMLLAVWPVAWGVGWLMAQPLGHWVR